MVQPSCAAACSATSRESVIRLHWFFLAGPTGPATKTSIILVSLFLFKLDFYIEQIILILQRKPPRCAGFFGRVVHL